MIVGQSEAVIAVGEVGADVVGVADTYLVIRLNNR